MKFLQKKGYFYINGTVVSERDFLRNIAAEYRKGWKRLSGTGKYYYNYPTKTQRGIIEDYLYTPESAEHRTAEQKIFFETLFHNEVDLNDGIMYTIECSKIFTIFDNWQWNKDGLEDFKKSIFLMNEYGKDNLGFDEHHIFRLYGKYDTTVGTVYNEETEEYEETQTDSGVNVSCFGYFERPDFYKLIANILNRIRVGNSTFKINITSITLMVLPPETFQTRYLRERSQKKKKKRKKKSKTVDKDAEERRYLIERMKKQKK